MTWVCGAYNTDVAAPCKEKLSDEGKTMFGREMMKHLLRCSKHGIRVVWEPPRSWEK